MATASSTPATPTPSPEPPDSAPSRPHPVPQSGITEFGNPHLAYTARMTLAQLLVVQEHDSAIDRLTHSRTSLPEFAALRMIDDERSHVERERSTVADERHRLEREQKRLEDDAALVTDRIEREEGRLYDGTVTAHKDLQAIQEELVTLRSRREGIEDKVLDAMEQGEPLDETLADFDAKLAAIEARRAEANESLASSQAAIDREIEAERAMRAEAVAEVAPELVEIYEATRAACGGVGICRLVDKTCQGCHLTLSAVEYDRLRKEPDDAIVRCGECNRILVR